jgi:hypothetical protein
MSLSSGLANLAIVRASNRRRLWLGAAGVVLFLATIAAGRWLGPQARAATNKGFGLDFIAFYTAGDFVAHSRVNELYDLNAVREYQHQLAAANQIDLGHAYGPWWNPPLYALIFVPFTRLSLPEATFLWLAINLACFALACVLLCRMLPAKTTWRTWMLVPILMIFSAPFILAVSHAQNTCTSLLLLTTTVVMWRSNRPLLAGLVGGFMFYKPQVAALVAIFLILDLGWKALLGYAITGTALLLTNLIALPGTLVDYLHRLPENVHSFQTQTHYPWEQHVTLKAFWRLLAQGHELGDASLLVVAATLLGSICLLGLLIRAQYRLRQQTGVADAPATQIRRDRLIAATIATTPLLMPFYFDYDLLLLSVPAVLLAVEMTRRHEAPNPCMNAPAPGPSGASGARWSEGHHRRAAPDLRPSQRPEIRGGAANTSLESGTSSTAALPRRRGSAVSCGATPGRLLDRVVIATWCLLYAWQMINTDVAEKCHLNLAVPIMTILALLLIRRAGGRLTTVQSAAWSNRVRPPLRPVPA